MEEEGEGTIPYKVEDAVVIRASKHEVDGAVSKLSPLDSLMPPFALNVCFFYSYSVDRKDLEQAMQTLLSRYPELSGRLDLAAGEIKLTNEGAQLMFLEPAQVCMTDLKILKFDYDLCAKHFNADKKETDEYLFKMAVQRLDKNEGMVLRFTMHHTVCDINSLYLLVADFCSLVRNKTFKFPAKEVISCKRLQYMRSSGKEPTYPHPEFEIVRPEKLQNLFEVFANYQVETVKELSISSEKLKLLKKEVLKTKGSSKAADVHPSTNDCMVSVLYRAFYRSEQLANPDPKRKLALELVLNTRCRRTPPIPKTFFGNGALYMHLHPTWEEVEKQSLYETAVLVRKGVTGFTEDYIQSSIDKIAQDKNYMPSTWFQSKFLISNWNHYFDWYNDANLGQGAPEKFGMYGKCLNKVCIVLPAREEGSLDLFFGANPEVMSEILKDPLIKKFFTCTNTAVNL